MELPNGPQPAELPGLHLLLDLPEAAMPHLRKSSLLAGGRRPLTRKLNQIFWDTADLILGKAGFALGIETVGRRRNQLTSAIARPPVGGGVRARSEHALGADRPDPTRLALLAGFDPTLLEALAGPVLIPVFAIDLTRTSWQIRWHATELKVTLETGLIESPRGKRSFHQLDLALAGGPAAGLYDFALNLHGEVPLSLATHDPVQRGYGLASGTDWWRAPAGDDVALDRAMSVRAGVLATGRAGVASIRAEIAALDQGLQPDRIHQARVAIRRFRSLLSVFRDAMPARPRVALGQDLSRYAGLLGHVREWDVFLSGTLEPMIRAVGEDRHFAGARFAASVLREEAAEQALAALAAPDFMALSLTLGAWFDAGIWPEAPAAEAASLLELPLELFARQLLRKRHRRLTAAVANLDDPHPGELHALRIEAKKLRYAVEFMQDLFPAKLVRRYVSGLKEIQLVLGTLNDAVVARRLVAKLVLPDAVAAAHLTGLVTGWTAAEITAATRQFAKAWGEFAETKPFWK